MRRRMAASVLVFEAFIALFFGLVVAKLNPGGDWLIAVVLGGVAVLLCGMMRMSWSYYAGWVLQAAFIAGGFLISDMFVIGVLFAGLWWAALHYGDQAERIRAEKMAAADGGAGAADDADGDGVDGAAVGASDGAAAGAVVGAVGSQMVSSATDGASG